MNGKKSRALRKIAKVLYLDYYKSLLPEGTEVTVEQAIKASPTLWKRSCRVVKRNPTIQLGELKVGP